MKADLKHYFPLLMLVSIAALVGCGPPDYYKCSGVVTHKGNPIPYLEITFEPEVLDSTRPPHALSNENGEFEMKCGRERGVPPGRYKVIVVDPAKADGGQTSTEPDYLYVTDRYSPLKSDLYYEADQHRTNWELELPEKEYTGPKVREEQIRNTTEI
jgi:hypothetical protein